ncbi:hypothetical protein H257_14928 [Aphanomyces astaci]|uniref:DDE Tnp4 domain-containing protein n=1 Tax=Aphanomyces astaci TaxID=112090 RepID=W4FQS3_APHAT|nr:hypothetical protein H257_14928 [Aphanomyces astaci]ETV69301.1 hypothetical protein H257_14928 [Aphanomyces astaci]|eukprot:XP_009841158.1 hypothetical protein H257_14928 [Aphanomyces astaci]
MDASAVVHLAPVYIVLPTPDAPTSPYIETNSKFFPFFSKCRMVIDGTHIPVWVTRSQAAAFQGRKRITMNVLAGCNFDLQFTYVLAGWEGTACDGKVYADAFDKGLAMDGDKFEITDTGFGLTLKCLTPYRGTRYHLKEYGIGRLNPQRKEELFNLRQAQLCNCIQRIFGIVKMRFPVLSHGVRYDYSFQVDLVLALVHNTQLYSYMRHRV